MARCGRCGLYSKYPEDHHEKKWAGVCLYFQHRITEDELYEKRECVEFFESVPGVTPVEQWSYKLQRDKLGEAFQEARQARREAERGLVIALIGVGLGLAGLILSGISTFLG